MQSNGFHTLGKWQADKNQPAFSPSEIQAIIPRFREPVHVIINPSTGHIGAGLGGRMLPSDYSGNASCPLIASLPALYPEWLGDRTFLEMHGVRFPYVAGEMYRGIASSRMVIEMAKAGMIGFFGAAGLSLNELEKNLDEIQGALDGPGLPWGTNLIFMPTEPELEEATVALYIRRKIERVSAAAYMALSPGIVQYASTGLHTDSSGRIHRKNHVFAKISRPEVAKPFMEPAPKEILDQLVAQGKLTHTEATLARSVPIAEDITVEADSGGHTDNRPLTVIFPAVLLLRNEMMAKYGFTRPIRIGAAGGLGTPGAVAAAFSMGAAYVLTGSINQSAVESGMSPEGRQMLAAADVADVTMAPAADMFELGVKVQVLKRGTMFCNRAANLYQIYSENESIDKIPAKIKSKLEKEVFHAPLESIWADTKKYFSSRKPSEVARAEKEPKYKMALVFRWYLGNSANWAIQGDSSHKIDYQICCGPSMGSFNAWVKGTFLQDPANRTVVQIGLNLLEGAAVITRAQQLRSYGVAVPESSFDFRPRPLA